MRYTGGSERKGFSDTRRPPVLLCENTLMNLNFPADTSGWINSLFISTSREMFFAYSQIEEKSKKIFNEPSDIKKKLVAFTVFTAAPEWSCACVCVCFSRGRASLKIDILILRVILACRG